MYSCVLRVQEPSQRGDADKVRCDRGLENEARWRLQWKQCRWQVTPYWASHRCSPRQRVRQRRSSSMERLTQINNCRPTADFSWPVWDVPLAEWVNSPNDSIDLNSHPSLRWFSLQDFFDQVHYLRQFGVDLE